MPVALLPEQLRIVELGVVKVGLDLGGVLVGALEAQSMETVRQFLSKSQSKTQQFHSW